MVSDLSVPRSPGSTFTADEEMVGGESNGLHLELAPFSQEHIYDYEPDGHHPVHFGDIYSDNGRCRIIYKLGSGGFATVWLCRDTEAKEATNYMALKILMAESSSDNCPELPVNRPKDAHSQYVNKGNGAEFICFPLDHFKLYGPNGDHISFVYPVLGPNVSLGCFALLQIRIMTWEVLVCKLRRLSNFFTAREYVMAVSRTSSNHFFLCWKAVNANKKLDITPNNILYRITRLDWLNKEEVLKY
jgi:hypothetical protein